MIVMLTKVSEKNSTKCDQYWPEKGSKEVENLFVISAYSELMLNTEELVLTKMRIDNLEVFFFFFFFL